MSSDAPLHLSDSEILDLVSKRGRPPSAELLGLEFLEIDQQNDRVTLQFEARSDFCNPIGTVQGGFLTAMLDDAMAISGVIRSGFAMHMPTLELKVSFLRPALPGKIRAVGEVVKFGKTIAFFEGSLYDSENRLIARASATARPTPRA